MMRPPPCSFMIGKTARLQRKVPVRQAPMTLFQAASEILSSRPPSNAPALLMRISTRPNRARAAATQACTPASSVTSSVVANTSAPAARNSATVFSSFAEFRAQMATWAPSAAKALAIPLPIPWLAPVMRATLPASRFTMSGFRVGLEFSHAHHDDFLSAGQGAFFSIHFLKISMSSSSSFSSGGI